MVRQPADNAESPETVILHGAVSDPLLVAAESTTKPSEDIAKRSSTDSARDGDLGSSTN